MRGCAMNERLVFEIRWIEDVIDPTNDFDPSDLNDY
jgi:hypothetical protein